MNSNARDRAALGICLLSLFTFISLMWFVFAIDQSLFAGSLYNGGLPNITLGIAPRQIDSIPGIFFHGFLHDDFAHLFGNTIGTLMFGLALALARPRLCTFLLITGIIVPGTIEWLFGNPYTIAVGASAMVYALTGAFTAIMFLDGFRWKSPILLFIGAYVLVIFQPFPIGIELESNINYTAHIVGYFYGVVGALGSILSNG